MSYLQFDFLGLRCEPTAGDLRSRWSLSSALADSATGLTSGLTFLPLDTIMESFNQTNVIINYFSKTYYLPICDGLELWVDFFDQLIIMSFDQ